MERLQAKRTVSRAELLRLSEEVSALSTTEDLDPHLEDRIAEIRDELDALAKEIKQQDALIEPHVRDNAIAEEYGGVRKHQALITRTRTRLERLQRKNTTVGGTDNANSRPTVPRLRDKFAAVQRFKLPDGVSRPMLPVVRALCLRVVFLAAVVATTTVTSATATTARTPTCPTACSCKWSGGKRTAECGGLSGSVPDHIPPDTQVLNLTGNVLQTLPGRQFQQARLLHLQRIYLSRCGIVQMADDAFGGLSNLVELDLSHNFLTAAPKLAAYCGHLRRLQLSFNPIQRLGGHSFKGLRTLVSLELSQCQLAWLEGDTFADLETLELLKLDGNRLRTLPPEGLQLPPLNSLDLSDNPWRCDCNLRELRRWMQQHNVPLSVPPKCDAPVRLAQLSWTQLEPDDFACAPQ
ncbi:hypothetical protein HPB47_027812, partial [Ixodes persulcatus]